MSHAVLKKPTYNRQKFLLSFIRQLRAVNSTDLQKLVFLYSMRHNKTDYEFIPYKFGSFSFQLQEDLEILERDNFIAIRHAGDAKQIVAVGSFSSDIHFPIDSERGRRLIQKSYMEYPYYSINSDIAESLLAKEDSNLINAFKKSFKKTNTVLFTIGYEGKSIEYFMNQLIRNDIRALIDIRKNPISRKFGFSKTKLSHISKNLGIFYKHIPELGIESNKRMGLITRNDFEVLFNYYRSSLQLLNLYLDDISKLLENYTRIAIMCYEQNPLMCHRHVVRDFLCDQHGYESEDI